MMNHGQRTARERPHYSILVGGHVGEPDDYAVGKRLAPAFPEAGPRRARSWPLAECLPRGCGRTATATFSRVRVKRFGIGPAEHGPGSPRPPDDVRYEGRVRAAADGGRATTTKARFSECTRGNPLAASIRTSGDTARSPFAERDLTLVGAAQRFCELCVPVFTVGIDLGRTSRGLCVSLIRVYRMRP
jgi:hypothetical protein